MATMRNTVMVTEDFTIYKLPRDDENLGEEPLFALDGSGAQPHYLTLVGLKDLRDGLDEYIRRYESSRAPDLEF